MKIKPIHDSNDALNVFLILHQLKLEILKDVYQLQEEFTNASNVKARNI